MAAKGERQTTVWTLHTGLQDGEGTARRCMPWSCVLLSERDWWCKQAFYPAMRMSAVIEQIGPRDRGVTDQLNTQSE